MKIPYGTSNFALLRKEGYFYADKTPFLPLLESAELGYRYLVFLRPRRMGKSLFVSMLEHYYDLCRANDFDDLFRGLWIHEHPTREKNRYLVLNLNFSTVSAGGGGDTLKRTFFHAVKSGVKDLLLRYQDLLPELGRLDTQLDTYQDAETLLMALRGIIPSSGYSLYVLIDEYDQFANALLSVGEEDLYSAITDKAGFVRTFYRTLKVGTEAGAIGRIFVTGASPILLDALMSGFNIVTNISLEPQFDTLAGFTRADVERAVDELFTARPELAKIPGIEDRTKLLQVLERYYDGYRFAGSATKRVFNSDMVLYFLRTLSSRGAYPIHMLDPNVRTDYGKLQRLAMAAGPAGENRRKILEAILDKGEVESEIVEQFGSRSLSSRAQFISLLYYLGMLTLVPEPPVAGQYRLEIPNQVIRELQWEHLALMLEEHEDIDIDKADLTQALLVMTRKGEVEPFLELFQVRVIKAMGLKDFRRFDEKSLKLMLLAFISVSRVFRALSEKELAQGYCDLFLGPSGQVPDARYAWLLEIKYLPVTARAREIEKAFAQAEAQLERYASDEGLVPMVTQGLELKAGSVVFVSGKDVLFRPWPREKPAQRRKAR